ncbi:KxYKxGKxW signal peptide domain-containing protein [Lactococcus lactis]|uniref:KxYKxGKxW signal peptide domain-containing protein n=1 Tax=Lactococcus lactis TaxID=1358 RepID=UPI00288DEF54|nr:KxYKxGKxW signal peptide domain-containing protein [Lactococcus lactis]MDT2851017.1 KxYKxGKxW signal peptide domain-containing protein [Lactococcus lactis]
MEKQKHHFRTWKSGKIWLFCSGILLIFVIGSIGLTAQADEVPSNTETMTQSSDVTTQSSPVSPTVNSSLAASDSTTEEPAVVSNMENTAQASSSTNILTTESSTVDTNSPTQSNQSSIAISLTKASSESSINEPASTIANETTTTADVTTQTTATQAQTSDPTTSLSSESQGKPKNPSQSKSPEITNIQVTGAVDNNATGSAVFDGVNITLQGKDITDDNLLDPSGLHWSEQTQVIAIKGTATGQLNQENFGVQDGPIIPATTYTMNDGDSGRLTYIGKTLSGLDLDMIYTVASSDKDSWQDNEGADGIPQGLAFTGEQNIADSGGNSIVCLYNGANALSLIYQIVKHDTTTEVPVVASFITTDIDIAQGVQTNLANLVTILPQTTNLKQDGDTIYDASPNYPGLDGVASLPYGGYLGAGFVSEFYYNYYAPAPERAEDSYFFAQGVRYDLFGSALQAHMNTQIRQNFIVNYYDEFGHKIQDTDHYIGFTGQDYNLPIPTIPYYGFVNMTENDSVKNNPVINLIYTQSLPNYYGYPQTSSYGYSGNNIQYAGVNYKPSFTINYQNTGVPTATITYSPINSSKADSVTIPLTMSGGNTDIIYPSMQSVANKNSFSNSMNVNYENMAKNFGITSDQAKELYNDLYVASTTLEKNPNDGFADYLAGVHYSDGFAGLLQKPLNSIPKGYDYSKISDILGVINKKGNGIDLSHLGTSMGAYYETGAIKISGNLLAGGYSLPALIESLTGHDSNLRDTKLMTDTLTGDALTNLNASDEAADMDAYILTHFPDYKGLTTAEAFAKYYSLPNLDTALREKMYLESMSGGKGDSGVAMGGFAVFSLAFASLGTAYAAGGGLYGLFKSLKDRNAAAKSLQTTGKLVGQLTKISGDALKRVVTKKVQQLSTSIQKVVKVVQNTANSLKNKAISAFKGATQSVSQVFNSFKAKVISVGQNVKSFINQGVKVAKQSLNTVIEVAKQKAAAAAQAFRQTSQWLTQQARNTGNAIWNGVQTAYHTVSNFVTGVYNNYVAPTVNYVTNTVSKVYNNYVKPVVNSAIHAYHAVTNFIGSAYNSAKSWVSNKVNAVGKWLKSLW